MKHKLLYFHCHICCKSCHFLSPHFLTVSLLTLSNEGKHTKIKKHLNLNHTFLKTVRVVKNTDTKKTTFSLKSTDAGFSNHAVHARQYAWCESSLFTHSLLLRGSVSSTLESTVFSWGEVLRASELELGNTRWIHTEAWKMFLACAPSEQLSLRWMCHHVGTQDPVLLIRCWS